MNVALSASATCTWPASAAASTRSLTRLVTACCARPMSSGLDSESLKRSRAMPRSSADRLTPGIEPAATMAPASRSSGSSRSAMDVSMRTAYDRIASSNRARSRSSLLSKYW